jgi:hypothetical protein
MITFIIVLSIISLYLINLLFIGYCETKPVNENKYATAFIFTVFMFTFGTIMIMIIKKTLL